MARAGRNTAENAEATAVPEETPGEDTQEPTLDGMPQGGSDDDSAATATTDRAKVPLELRAVFNEIGRLSGILAIARRATYDNRPDRVLGALELLEEATPAARKMAQLTTD